MMPALANRYFTPGRQPPNDRQTGPTELILSSGPTSFSAAKKYREIKTTDRQEGCQENSEAPDRCAEVFEKLNIFADSPKQSLSVLQTLDLRFEVDRMILTHSRYQSLIPASLALQLELPTSPVIPLFDDPGSGLRYKIWPYMNPTKSYSRLQDTPSRPGPIAGYPAAILHNDTPTPAKYHDVPTRHQAVVKAHAESADPSTPALPALLCMGDLLVQEIDPR